MSKWDLRKMYWKNGATMTVKRMEEENQKRLDPETIKKINSRVEELAEAIKEKEVKLAEPCELKGWQQEIINENED